MQKPARHPSIFAAPVIGATLLLSSPLYAQAGKPVVGYLYTTTNGGGVNQVVRLARYGDGSLGDEKTYSTMVRGGADPTAPALGDYDAQGQTRIVGHHLLTADVGANMVSVFRIDRPTGALGFVANVPSHGDKPVSISSTAVQGQPGKYWVVVGNQWGQPTVIYGGAKLTRLPSDAFLKDDLSKPDASDVSRTIALYQLDDASGALTYTRTLDEYPRENGGASEVSFSPEGDKLAVTTWGIPHLLTDDPKLSEMHPSRVYMYDFAEGVVSHRRQFQEAGIAGSVGFEWGPRSRLLYVTNFSLTNAKGDNGLTVLRHDGDQLTKVANFATGMTHPKDIDEACWSVMSPAKDMLYVVSYATNVITPFRLDPVSGKVLERLPLITRGTGYAPGERLQRRDDFARWQVHVLVRLLRVLFDKYLRSWRSWLHDLQGAIYARSDEGVGWKAWRLRSGRRCAI